MTHPLALLLHDKMMPGSKLATKFEELDFRVATISDPAELLPTAQREMPMIVAADLTNRRGDVLEAIVALHAAGATAHIPVIAYAAREDDKLRESALAAGVKVMATETTILPHLAQFVEHALHIE